MMRFPSPAATTCAADANATRIEHIKDLVTQAVVIDAKDKSALASPILDKGPANEVVEKEVDLYKLPIGLSLAAIAGILGTAVICSLLRERRGRAQLAGEP